MSSRCFRTSEKRTKSQSQRRRIYRTFLAFQQQLPEFQTVSGALNLQPDFSNVLSGSGNPLENMTPEGFQQRVQNANAQNGLNYQPTDFFPGINERMQNAQQPQTGMNDPNNAFLLGGNF